MAFKLLGWDDLYGQFPAPVIPIGRLNGQLVAVYPGGKKHSEPVEESATYTRFTNEQLTALQGFNRTRRITVRCRQRHYNQDITM